MSEFNKNGEQVFYEVRWIGGKLIATFDNYAEAKSFQDRGNGGVEIVRKEKV